MARTIVVHFAARPGEESDLIHRLRNYGEDVFRRLRENGWGEVDLDEVDRATRKFSISRIKQTNCRRLMRWLEEEAARQNLLVSLELQLPDT